MILGIGVDIIEIERIKKAINKKSFKEKIFTEKELKKLNQNINSLSGNFAAKEAISKALGTGFRYFSPKEIEILRNDKGWPFVNLYGEALTLSNKKGVKNIHISISHNITMAIAYAILE